MAFLIFIQNFDILMARFLRVILHAYKILKFFFLEKYKEILEIAKVLAPSGTEFETFLQSHETFTSCVLGHIFNPNTEAGEYCEFQVSQLSRIIFQVS